MVRPLLSLLISASAIATTRAARAPAAQSATALAYAYPAYASVVAQASLAHLSTILPSPHLVAAHHFGICMSTGADGSGAFDDGALDDGALEAAELYRTGKVSGTAQHLGEIHSTNGSSFGGSVVSEGSLGPSASEAGTFLQMGELVKAVNGLQEGLAAMVGRMDDLENKKSQGVTCFNCGATGHSLKSCPEPIQQKYKKLYEKLNKE